MIRSVRAAWLGRRPYDTIHTLQQELLERRKLGELGDIVLFVEHEPVITFGRGAKPADLLVAREELGHRRVALAETGRGGDITLHAPGQLVCYPILDLAPDRCDVRRYVKDLAEVMRRLALSYGIGAGTLDKYIGVWADAASPEAWRGQEHAEKPVKLGAIGVRISRWVTMHGFAFNLSTDLSLFQLIVPCGIREYGVGSVASLTGQTSDVREAAERALSAFLAVFDAKSGGLESDVPGL
ncbi:MAG TPA: lipoyl(octanoyl) transferase LipB [Polyangiaceae bacterium]|jgi:lipoyl(octanoyl) transferase